MTTVNIKEDTLKLMDSVISFYEEGKHHWTSGVMARNYFGRAVNWFATEAVCFCVVGAFVKKSTEFWKPEFPWVMTEHGNKITEKCLSSISHVIGDRVGYWNDHSKFPEILETLKITRKKIEDGIIPV